MKSNAKENGRATSATASTLAKQVEVLVKGSKNTLPNTIHSVFWKHSEEFHDGDIQPIKLSVLSSHPGDAMLRQITEAINIEERKPDLNRKDEWGNKNIPRKRKDASESSHHR